MNFTDMSTADLISVGRVYAEQISVLKERIESIEAVLKSRALNVPHEPLANGSREGRRATLKEGDQSVSVVFESDLLKGSFAFDSDLTTNLQGLCGNRFDALFRTKTTCERRITDGHKFRILVHSELPESSAVAVIEALKDKDKSGIVKSKVSVEWNPKKS